MQDAKDILQPFTTYQPTLSSFPRKRESIFESHSFGLDSRLRGNDDLYVWMLTW
jgi:hypothetical protein